MEINKIKNRKTEKSMKTKVDSLKISIKLTVTRLSKKQKRHKLPLLGVKERLSAQTTPALKV